MAEFTYDANNNLNVNLAAGSITGGNAAASTTGSPVPANADYQGVNIGGTLIGVTGFSLTNSKAEAVAIVDGSGNQITSFGGGTQYVDGTTETAGAFTGTAALGYNGTKVEALRQDASNNLLVNVNTALPTGANTVGKVDILGNSGAAMDAAGQNAASPANELIVGGQFNTTPTTLTSGNVSPLQLDSAGNLLVNVKVGGGSSTSNQGSPNTLANAWPMEITDGTHGPAAVKAASTAAVATDPALVVAVSPNNSVAVTGTVSVNALPTGSNTVGKVDILGNAGAAMDAAGQNASSPANELIVGGQFNTTPTTITSGNVSPLQLDASGNLLVNVKAGSSGNAAASATGSAVPASADYVGVNIGGNLTGVTGVSLTNAKAMAVEIVDGSGNQITSFGGGTQYTDGTTETAGAFTGTAALGYNGTKVEALRQDASNNLLVNLNTAIPTGANVIGAVTQSGAPWTVQGDSASGASKAGNPVQVGGVFNTTQPTVTTGQTVESQSTARGASIVATGADTFNVTVNAALPTGGNTIGAVTQASGPWTNNLTQVAGTALGATAVTNYGTAPAAAAVPGVNAFVTNTPTVNIAASQTIAVTQATAANLNATVTGTVSVNALPTGSNTIGKVDILGNAGATLDSTIGAATAPTNAIATSGVYDTTAPAPTNGQAVAVQIDQAGNQLLFPGVQFKTGAAWTSATGSGTFQYPTGTTTAGQLSGAAAVAIQLDQTTTLTGGAVTFQGTFDNINWVTIPVAQVLNPATFASLTNPYTFAASTNQPFLIVAQGYVNVRADLTTVITGTGSVTPYWATLAESPCASITISPNQPTSNMVGTVPGTAPADTTIVGGIFNSSAPTPSTGQTLPLQLNSAGALNVAPVAGTNTIGKVDVLGNAGATLDSTIGAATAPTNAIATSAVYQTTVPALTAGQAVAAQCDTTGAQWVNKDSRRQTYRMSARGFTPVASATAPIVSLQGSASKTVRITKITVTGYCTTGTTLPATVSIQKFSVLTGGTTGSTPTGALQDSNNAAQTAVMLQYSAVPTTATVIGGITDSGFLQWVTGGATVAQPTSTLVFTFGDDGGQQLVLRGTAQYAGVILSSIGTTPVMSVVIEWIEDNS
jgi:hypothetical protein